MCPVAKLEHTRRAGARHVLIVGGGVAGLEALLALRALAGRRVRITMLAPEAKFMNLSMSVDQPFKPPRGRGIRLSEIARQGGTQWVQARVDRVEPAAHRVIAHDGTQISYQTLVLAIGARARREWEAPQVLTYHGNRDGSSYQLLLRRLREGHIRRLAFIKPAGPTWPLPLYDLALMTAATMRAQGREQAELTLITPEQEPLGIFGRPAADAVRALLGDAGVRLCTSSYATPHTGGRLVVSPGLREVRVDQVVSEPSLEGPRLRGIPCGRHGFIRTDTHGRVLGLQDVFAAGDATAFPIKQGGIAAQQADVVAEAIAAACGAKIEPRPLRPVLRGVLLTGAQPWYVRADVSGGAGDDSMASQESLWWPPDKLCGRYLAPYLSSQVGEASDVMPQGAHTLPVHAELTDLRCDSAEIREPMAPESGRGRRHSAPSRDAA